jgi:hypothetical protein
MTVLKSENTDALLSSISTCFPILLAILLIVKFMSFVDLQPVGVPCIGMLIALYLRCLCHVAWLTVLQDECDNISRGQVYIYDSRVCECVNSGGREDD